MFKFPKLKTSFIKHRPEIFTSLGIGAGIGAIAMTISSTIKAYKRVQAKKEEEGVEKLPAKEIIKTTWSCYIPVVVLEASSILFLVESTRIGKESIIALSAACLNAESAFQTYKEKVVETIGENKEKLIHDKAVEEQVNSDPVTNNEVIITGKGNTLCYDTLSGQYFNSDVDTIKQKVNELNRRMLLDNCISINELCDELNIRHMKTVGNIMGWNINRGYIDIRFSAMLSDDGRPCIVLDHNLAPVYDFDRL